MKLGVEFGAVPFGIDQVAARAACDLCDGTGCPCVRMRDWQSIEQRWQRQYLAEWER